MIDPIAASSSTDGARLTSAAAPTPKSTSGGADFAGELARYSTSSSSTSASKATDAAKVADRPKNEKLAKVSGHPFSRVVNGDDKGMYLNQLGSSPREGKVFKLVKHGDHVLHVYGTGKDKVVVEVKSSKAKTDTATGQPTGGTTPSTTTSSTTTPSTTTPSTTTPSTTTPSTTTT